MECPILPFVFTGTIRQRHSGDFSPAGAVAASESEQLLRNYPELLTDVACGHTLTFALKAVRQINGTDK